MKGITPVEVSTVIKNALEALAVVVALVKQLRGQPRQGKPRRKNRKRR
jgi:hypothetical protein